MVTAGAVRVLYVDDDPERRDAVAGTLERNDGYTVVTATDASEAQSHLDGDPVDCVVSDYGVPGTEGLEFLRTVREDHPDLPFILFPADGSEALASEAISAGVTDYVRKNGSDDRFARLRDHIDDAVEQCRERTNYREVFEKVPDGVLLHDPDDGTILDANDEFCDMMGYGRSELLDLDFDAIHAGEQPYTVERAEELVRQAAREGPQTFEWVNEQKDGERLPVEVHLRQTVIDGGERVLAVVRDITDRREREAELEETNALLSTLFDTLPVGVLAEDGSRNIMAINDQMFDLFEMPGTPEDLVGADCEQMAERASEQFTDPERFVTRTNELVAERTPVDDEEFALADGRTVVRQYQPIELPDGDGHLWVYHDITDRKERERELATLRERTAFALEETESVIWGIDVDTGELTSVQGPVTTLFGDVVREVTDVEEFLDRGVHPDDREQVVQAYRAVVDGETDRVTTEFRTDLDRNETRWVSVDAYLQTDDGARELVGLTTDITDRKRRERELERQNERLEEFASVVSHDLRSPLSVAQARLELAGDDCDSDHLEPLGRALDRMEALIDDILTIARHGEQVHDAEDVGLGETVDRCWQNVETANATLVVEDDRHVIRADQARLKQLLENLLRNAVEHATDDVTVTVGTLPDGFYVEDDGPGIPEDERDDVFDTGYSTSDEGTGFGLSIVDEIADAHGWDVAVTDGTAGGARFEVTGVETSGE